MNFNKVQFIGVAMCTTPSGLNSIEDTSDDGYYAGLTDQNRDIDARISFLKRSLSDILSSDAIDLDETTLKIIVFPEFLMRGTMGAYPISVFLPYVSELLQLSEKEDVLVVIGSVLTSEMEPSMNSDFYNMGNELLDIYYRLHGKNQGRMRLHNLLKSVDEGCLRKANYNDDSFDDILVKALDYSDLMAKQIVDNRCYVISKSFCHTILKQHKSKEDFVLNTANQYPIFLQTTTKYAEISEDEDVNESVFSYGGLRIGVEICLDHKRKRLKDAGVSSLDVQIIPSCGMTIREESVVVENGFVFNCDGEYVLNSPDQGVDGINCHTSLRVVTGSKLGNAMSPKCDEPKSDGCIKDLYSNESYNVHYYPSMDIPQNG